MLPECCSGVTGVLQLCCRDVTPVQGQRIEYTSVEGGSAYEEGPKLADEEVGVVSGDAVA